MITCARSLFAEFHQCVGTSVFLRSNSRISALGKHPAWIDAQSNILQLKASRWRCSHSSCNNRISNSTRNLRNKAAIASSAAVLLHIVLLSCKLRTQLFQFENAPHLDHDRESDLEHQFLHYIGLGEQ